MINAIWDNILHCVSEWKNSVKKGKILLENNQKNLEACLLELNAVIIKLKGFENTLSGEKVKDNKRFTVLGYLEKIIEMFRMEFDLKTSIAGQVAGTFEKRRMITYIWVMESYIDEGFISGLPNKIDEF